MRKSLFNLVIFIFHILSLILLVSLCIHFEIITLDFDGISKESVVSFFKNDYVVNIICTILTAVALYIFQIKYSKHKLKTILGAMRLFTMFMMALKERINLSKKVTKCLMRLKI